ncbi:IS3 family transposase [Bacillus stercoris]
MKIFRICSFDLYIDEYNNCRYQWVLKKMTPAQYHKRNIWPFS